MFNISLVQFTPVMGDAARNLQEINTILEGVETALIVLPELCTSGYSFISREEAMEAAEDATDPTLAFFSRLAEEKQAVIVAGFAEKSGTRVYNSALVALPGNGLKVSARATCFFARRNALMRATQVFSW